MTEIGFFGENSQRHGLPLFVSLVDAALQQATTLMARVAEHDDRVHLACQLSELFLKAGNDVLAMVVTEDDSPVDVEETATGGDRVARA
jgi:hypothetical protein